MIRSSGTGIALAAVLSLTVAQVSADANGAAAPVQAPQPAPELAEYLQPIVGNWLCTTTFAAGAFGTDSAPVKAVSKLKIAKGEALLGGFFYRGEVVFPKSKEMPMQMSGVFYIGYEPASRQVVSVTLDNAGTIMMGAGRILGAVASWTGEGYMNGKKVKTRETFTKTGPKELTHKIEADLGKGFQVLAEDLCKK